MLLNVLVSFVHLYFFVIIILHFSSLFTSHTLKPKHLCTRSPSGPSQLTSKLNLHMKKPTAAPSGVQFQPNSLKLSFMIFFWEKGCALIKILIFQICFCFRILLITCYIYHVFS
jgi:hypothetical protein